MAGMQNQGHTALFFLSVARRTKFSVIAIDIKARRLSQNLEVHSHLFKFQWGICTATFFRSTLRHLGQIISMFTLFTPHPPAYQQRAVNSPLITREIQVGSSTESDSMSPTLLYAPSSPISYSIETDPKESRIRKRSLPIYLGFELYEKRFGKQI